MWTRQQKSSGDAGCDPALQLAQAGQAPLSPPSAYLPQQKGALISFGKYYLQVSIMEKNASLIIALHDKWHLSPELCENQTYLHTWYIPLKSHSQNHVLPIIINHMFIAWNSSKRNL